VGDTDADPDGVIRATIDAILDYPQSGERS
jgi:hypothetical protein